MSRKRLLGIVCITIVVFLGVSFVLTAGQGKKRYYYTVGYGGHYDYTSIQEAADNAEPGYTLLIGEGVFLGAYISKALKIIGSGEETIIVNNYFGYCFFVDGRWGDVSKTEISNLTCESDNDNTSVVIMGADDVWVKDNQMRGGNYGVYIEGCKKIHLSNNSIQYCKCGICINSCHKCRATDNTMNECTYYSIYLLTHSYYQKDLLHNFIGFNTMMGSNIGIKLRQMGYDKVEHNTFINNNCESITGDDCVDMDCCVSVLAENCYAPNGDFTVRHLQFINHGEYVSCIADEAKRCRSIRLSPCISEAAESHVNMPGYCLLD